MSPLTDWQEHRANEFSGGEGKDKSNADILALKHRELQNFFYLEKPQTTNHKPQTTSKSEI